MTDTEIPENERSDAIVDSTISSFMNWQCSLRQQTVRMGDGRPLPGMCPEVVVGSNELLGRIVVVMLKKELQNYTAQFQHMVKKTRDPIERWEAAINTLSTSYYQQADTFSPRLTALFGPDSQIRDRLLETGQCTLMFEQNGRTFEVPCEVCDLPEENPEYIGTFWHNSMFNPNLPGGVKILSFEPDWIQAKF